MQTIGDKLKNLGLTQEHVKQGIEILQQPREVFIDGKRGIEPPAVIVEGDTVALARTFRAEVAIADEIRRLAACSTATLEVPPDVWGAAAFTPHHIQVEALNLIARTNVSVLTGGPGTGKTTIVQAVVRMFEHAGLRCILAAPTGKAAIRLSEQAERPAMTVHRMLGWKQGGWHHTAANSLPGGVVILDESSMVDTHLCADVLVAVKDGARVLFVGDVDQLPSIGAGRVLFDLITSGELPIVRLTKIFRQASESRIPWVARDVNEGRCPSDLHAEGTDVRFLERDNVDDVLRLIVLAVTKGIPEQKGIPSKDIQVLAAQKTKGVGVEMLNNTLQQALNHTDDHELDVFIGGGYSARKHDRVIHIHNNYELAVMNGEQGWVLDNDPSGIDMDKWPNARTSEEAARELRKGVDEDDWDDDDDGDAWGATPQWEEDREPKKRNLKKKYVLIVDYTVNGTERQVAYTKAETAELLLAYAITVHKSQGSQFPAVVMVTHSCHQWMLTRQLIYTGITRAEKYLLMIGQEAALAKAAGNTRGAIRRTRLQERLRAAPEADVASSLSNLTLDSNSTGK
jgi:exodeoxyribonuclease V alpha subunit